jgi:hypothetical protein
VLIASHLSTALAPKVSRGRDHAKPSSHRLRLQQNMLLQEVSSQGRGRQVGGELLYDIRPEESQIEAKASRGRSDVSGWRPARREECWL